MKIREVNISMGKFEQQARWFREQVKAADGHEFGVHEAVLAELMCEDYFGEISRDDFIAKARKTLASEDKIKKAMSRLVRHKVFYSRVRQGERWYGFDYDSALLEHFTPTEK